MHQGPPRLTVRPRLPGLPGVWAGGRTGVVVVAERFHGGSPIWREITRAQVKFWFGGPDNATNSYSKSVIFATLDEVFDAIKSDDFDIDCEGGSGN